MNEKNNRDIALQKYAAARSNLLVMVCFTLVNIVLLFLKADVMMLFSATVPYFAAVLGLVDESGLLLVPGILDLAIHIWVLYYLIVGVKYGKQLKNMPEEVPEVQMEQPPEPTCVEN